jgi:MarR family transcriptional regulator for hemolysin
MFAFEVADGRNKRMRAYEPSGPRGLMGGPVPVACQDIVAKDVKPMDNDISPEWNPEASASFWINRASKSLLRRQDERLRPLGFGMSQISIVGALADGGSASQKDLAERAQVEQPTMAEMLARMERDGVITRKPNPNDGRGTLASLTTRARRRLPKARAALIRGEQEVLAGFSAAEKGLLLALLQRVVGNLEGKPIS